MAMRWTKELLTRTIVATLLNRYDYFMVIEGGTGIGKSTLGVRIAMDVSREFKRLYWLNEDVVEYYYKKVGEKLFKTPEKFIEHILELKEKKAYRFNVNKDLVYSQDAMQRALASWNKIFIADELVNVAFNRDFQSQKQKDIVKMVNMFRDHSNIIIACVPYFSTIDNQIKNLTKMKITVKKRGVAIIHTPNDIIYSKDKWDSATNEKIERQWIYKKVVRPNYARLTTYRGIIRFPPMTHKQETLYKKIKDEKRSKVLKEEMKVDVTDVKTKEPFDKFMEVLLNGGIRNASITEGFAMHMGIDPETLRHRIRRKLIALGKPNQLSHYYWDKKAKKEPEENSIEVEAIAQML